MKKTDKSKHNICIAAIKRSTIKPYDYKFTKFYESNEEFAYSGMDINLKENELIICSTVMNANNYSILTTQQLITNKNNVLISGQLKNSKHKKSGMFKSIKDDFVFGSITLENGSDVEYFIETGKAAMIMVNGIKTLIRIQ